MPRVLSIARSCPTDGADEGIHLTARLLVVKRRRLPCSAAIPDRSLTALSLGGNGGRPADDAERAVRPDLDAPTEANAARGRSETGRRDLGPSARSCQRGGSGTRSSGAVRTVDRGRARRCNRLSRTSGNGALSGNGKRVGTRPACWRAISSRCRCMRRSSSAAVIRVKRGRAGRAVVMMYDCAPDQSHPSLHVNRSGTKGDLDMSRIRRVHRHDARYDAHRRRHWFERRAQ